MIRHHFHHDTGEYIRSQESHHEVGFSTTKPLPDIELAENEYFAMLDGSGNVDMFPDGNEVCDWVVKTRFEKVTAYSKQTIEPQEFDDKSLVTDDYTLTNPPHRYVIWSDELDDWQNDIDKRRPAKNAEINRWRDIQEADTSQKVIVHEIEWDADPSARARINATLASDYTPPFWTDANNIDQPITQEVLKAIHTAIVQLGFKIHARQRQMKAEIEKITDFDALNDYVVGWPAPPEAK